MVRIKNPQRKVKINSSVLKKTASKILQLEELSDGELSLVLVDNNRITRLNRIYRNENSATDVLAFPLGQGADETYSDFTLHLLGDVVISVEMAQRQAHRFGKTVAEELALYLIHGILHLKGYNDQHPKDRQKMFRRQRVILKNINKEDIKKLVITS